MNDTRRYAKTPRAWEALARPDVVGRQAHTLLLMANGRRTERELALLLGGDVKELLQSLHQRGYLHCAASATTSEDDDALAGA
ncbi:hypothetical protein [Hydrogenophaga laconesensis]|uniref:MarR family transcriptional regulator n=1 Tax=Hydrogenophaga laconesensis TaxID=1805971 RepID=A0ABU1V9X5_9BURK|nr:hypothetical protein [Hydrogenophaga laconesensis]MDR7094242.1 hypothetical protein [Hydrogenophaga laconesensis]